MEKPKKRKGVLDPLVYDDSDLVFGYNTAHKEMEEYYKWVLEPVLEVMQQTWKATSYDFVEAIQETNKRMEE